MVRTKQTARGSSSTRPAGMQEATIGDVLAVDQDIPEKDWPDMDKLFRTATQQATQTYTKLHKQVSQQVRQVKVVRQ